MSDGVLLKLTILPFEDSENVQLGAPAGPPFVAQFNPESFTVSNQAEYGPDQPADGDTGSEAKFKSLKPRTFGFDLLLDGTGADGKPKREVTAQIQLFRLTTGFSGKIHRPHFLVITWGTFLATCVLESWSINYKLFRSDGTPLRAVLSATFREHTDSKLGELTKNLSSPDIIHAHTVRGGEHLSLITHRIYKDPRYYLHVADANGLDNLRHLETGTNLQLPPVE